jgi:Uma2 family endonuclease
MPNLVRLPDVSFVSWDTFPGRRIPKEAVPKLAPDLAIEVLSKGNTKGEMARKVREYFESGVRLVWVVDPKKKTLTQYASVRDKSVLGEDDTVEGGDVLPGFSLPLADLFAELDERG